MVTLYKHRKNAKTTDSGLQLERGHRQRRRQDRTDHSRQFSLWQVLVYAHMCLILYPDVGTADEAPYDKQRGERGGKWSLLSISMCPRMLPMCSRVLVCLVCLVLTDRHSSR